MTYAAPPASNRSRKLKSNLLASAAALMLLSSTSLGAHAADGKGGSGSFGAGGASSMSGAGSVGVGGIFGGGGGGGSGVTGGAGGIGGGMGGMGSTVGGAGGQTAGASGGAGQNAAFPNSGGGGGGGGAHGYVSNGLTLPSSDVSGGSGGNGGVGRDSAGGGGGGGGGGFGIVIQDASNATLNILNAATGGNGGAGGADMSSGIGGVGGNGGTGLLFTDLDSQNTVTLSGNVTGGNGGTGGSSGGNLGGKGGDGALGISIVDGKIGSTLALTVENSAIVKGGNGGAGGNAGYPSDIAGGNGGAAINFDGLNTHLTLNIGGTVLGGMGGDMGLSSGFPAGTGGTGGVGVFASNARINVGPDAIISGGVGGYSNDTRTIRAASGAAIAGSSVDITLVAGATINGDIILSGAGNRLSLLGDGIGYAQINGNVTSALIVGANAVLALGGSGGSFDMSAVGTGNQFSGFGGMEISGSGIWTLTGASSAILPMNIQSGTLSIASDATLGSGLSPISFTGIQGTLQTTATFTSDRNLILQPSGTAEIKTDAGTTLTLNGTVINSGTLSKTGEGTLVLTSAFNGQGVTEVRDGRLEVGSSAALGDSFAIIKMEGGTLAATESFDSAHAIQMNAASTIDTNANTLTLTGPISGEEKLTKTGSGTLAISGNNTDFTSDVTISQGTLQISGGRSIGDSARVSIAQGSTLEIIGNNNSSNDGETIGSLNGAGNIAFSGNSSGIRVGGNNTDMTLSGAISGSGGILKQGTGTLTISGSYSAQAVGVESGTLAFSGAASASTTTMLVMMGTGRAVLADSNLTFAALMDNGGASSEIDLNGHVLTIGTFAPSTYSGKITGEGKFRITGNGALSLSGNNDYSGGTIINHASLIAYSAAALGTGDILIENAGTLRVNSDMVLANAIVLSGENAGGGGAISVDAAKTLTVTSAISGGEALLVNGEGSLILTADNTYTGGTTIAEDSTLQLGNGGTTGSIVGSVANNGTLIFNRSGEYTIDNQVTGDGEMKLMGGGKVSFGSAFAGEVAVEETQVTLNQGSTTAASFSINSGGLLGGSATIGGLIVNDGGVVAPGYSPGTLTVNGPVAFNAGSTYRVDATPSGAHDLITATGAVTISSDASVAVIGESGAYKAQSAYAIVTTSDVVTGTFGNVTSNYAFLTPTLTYDANNVYLNLVYTGGGTDNGGGNNGGTDNGGGTPSLAGFTQNQKNTAIAALALGNGNAVFNAAVGLTNDAAPAALNMLSGEIHSSVDTVILQQSGYVRDALSSRMRQTSLADGALKTASVAAGPVSAEGERNFDGAMWAYGYGGWGKLDSNGNAGAVSNSIGGVMFGADGEVAPQLRAGVFGGFSRTSLDADSRASSGSIQSFDVGVYANAQIASLAIRSGLAHSWQDIETNRTIAFTGLSDAAKASYDKNTTQLFGEVAYGLSAGAYQFEPFAGLAYVHVSGADYAEEGGAAALSGKTNSMDTFYTTLGMRAATSVEFNGKVFTPSLTLGWQHAMGDLDPATSHAFSGAGSAFEVYGAPVDKNALLLGAGVSFDVSDKAKLSVNYTGQYGSDASQNAFNAQFSVKF